MGSGGNRSSLSPVSTAHTGKAARDFAPAICVACISSHECATTAQEMDKRRLPCTQTNGETEAQRQERLAHGSQAEEENIQE